MLCEALEAKKRKWFRCCYLSGVNGKKKRRIKKSVAEESKSTRRFVCVQEGGNNTEIGLKRCRREDIWASSNDLDVSLLFAEWDVLRHYGALSLSLQAPGTSRLRTTGLGYGGIWELGADG
jgi:hypothetical protein